MSKAKKAQGFIFKIFFALVAVLLLVTGNIHADDGPSYSINKLDINCKVEENGALQLTRTVTYKFHDSAHGLMYQQGLPKANADYVVEKVEVADNNGKFHNVANNETHANNTYSVLTNDQNDNFKIKTYHKISDGEKVTIRYVFTLNSAIVNYKDAARLNYKVIGFNTDVPQKNVNITFDMGKQNLNFLKVWVHTNAKFKKQISTHKGSINIKIKKLPANNSVETDILLPKSVTSQNTNVSDQEIIPAVTKQENKIMRNHQIQLFKKYGLIPLIIVMYAVIRFILIKIKMKRHGVLTMPAIPHIFDIPDISVGKAVAFLVEGNAKSLLNSSMRDSYAFAGELLQLYNQNKVAIERQEDDYQISIVDPQIIEKDNIYDVLFNTVGDGKTFNTKQLKKLVDKRDKCFAKRIADSLDEWFENYIEQIKDKYVNLKANSIVRNNKIYFVCTVIILGIWCFWYEELPIFILAIISLIVVILTLLNCRKIVIFNRVGLDEYLKIAGFKKMLLDIGNFKKSKFEDLLLWKDILPFAVGFNISDEVLGKLKQSFTEAELLQALDEDYIDFYDDNYFYISFTSRLNVFEETANDSSPDSDHDSFSGGDSGGFGGDSGDSAF